MLAGVLQSLQWLLFSLNKQGLLPLCMAQQWEKLMSFLAVWNLGSPLSLTVHRDAHYNFSVLNYLTAEILTHPLQDL